MINDSINFEMSEQYPMLIEYDNGGQDIFTCSYDIPDGCCFAVLETQFALEGRIIIGSVRTKQ